MYLFELFLKRNYNYCHIPSTSSCSVYHVLKKELNFQWHLLNAPCQLIFLNYRCHLSMYKTSTETGQRSYSLANIDATESTYRLGDSLHCYRVRFYFVRFIDDKEIVRSRCGQYFNPYKQTVSIATETLMFTNITRNKIHLHSLIRIFKNVLCDHNLFSLWLQPPVVMTGLQRV